MRMIRPAMTSLLLAGLLSCALTSCGASDPTAEPAKVPSNGTTPAVAKVDIKDLSTPFEKVMCSGQPSEAQFDALKAAGVTRVVHLRMANEKGTGWEEARAEESGVEFVRLEIAGKDGLTRSNVDAFAKLLAENSSGTTLVSCGSSNRVGAMFALKAFWIDKLSRDEALKIGTSAGMKSLTLDVEKLIDQ